MNADPAVGTLLHTELATKRWKERFVALGRSCPHPAAMPQLTSMLTVWAGAYHAHDIGLQYTVRRGAVLHVLPYTCIGACWTGTQHFAERVV